ncbi:MAG TPA: hypothetical protein VF790_10435 [Dissulfurispiraceae bacterium]
MAELGKLEKPPASDFAGKRKLYCVPDIYPAEDAPDEYKGLFDRYWDEVAVQIDKVENAGRIRKVFCEGVTGHGKEALDELDRMNERLSRIVRRKVEEGAELYPIESEEILGPFLDWGNCLQVVRTQEVFNKVLGFYSELSDARLKHITEAIDGALRGNEAGLLILRDEDRVKLRLPGDLEVFLVTPPSYDDLVRWIRERMREELKDVSVEQGFIFPENS